MARNAARTPSRIWKPEIPAHVEHEATTSKISDDQLFYCLSRGIGEEDAVSMIVDGFCSRCCELPMEFAVEAKKLVGISLKEAWDDVHVRANRFFPPPSFARG